jgi:glycerophosphoryl diester phosphodiesterase
MDQLSGPRALHPMQNSGHYAHPMLAQSATISSAMRTPLIIAHRGASGHAPENTLAAFSRSVELGAGFIETDLRLSRDLQFVVIHDSTLERTTNGRGAVHDRTLAELRELDAGQWFDRGFRGERIPCLEEILAFGHKHDVVFYLEIKYDGAWGMHHALVAAFRNAESAARAVVLSFDPATLIALRQLDSSIMVGLLAEEEEPDFVKASLDAGARQLCLRSTLVTPDLVQQAHRSDLQVIAWTVNSADEMRSMMATGVDGIMTDFPDRLRAVIEDEPSLPPRS